MISRRKFLKGLFGSVAALTVLPYMPKELATIQTVHLDASTIKPLGILQAKIGRNVRLGDVAYIDRNGVAQPMTYKRTRRNREPVGVYIGDNMLAISGTIQVVMKTDKPYLIG